MEQRLVECRGHLKKNTVTTSQSHRYHGFPHGTSTKALAVWRCHGTKAEILIGPVADWLNQSVSWPSTYSRSLKVIQCQQYQQSHAVYSSIWKHLNIVELCLKSYKCFLPTEGDRSELPADWCSDFCRTSAVDVLFVRRILPRTWTDAADSATLAKQHCPMICHIRHSKCCFPLKTDCDELWCTEIKS